MKPLCALLAAALCAATSAVQTPASVIWGLSDTLFNGGGTGDMLVTVAYDAAGLRILTLTDGDLAVSPHEASVAGGLPTGVHVVRLQTATTAHTQKLVVVR